MNYATVYGRQVQPNSCGRTAVDNRAIAFWQSRATTTASGVPAPFPLADLPALAAEVRATYPKEPQC